MRVSIVILTYQSLDGLLDTLRSILVQDYKDLEIVISDDATDGISEKDIHARITPLAEKYPHKICIRRNLKNLGIVAHANLAATCCMGEYIKFLSPGDSFCSDQAVSQMIAAARHTGCQIITSPSLAYVADTRSICYEFPSRRRIRILQRGTPEQLFIRMAANNIISAVGTVYHKSFFEEGGFDDSYRNLDDWPTWLRYFNSGKQMGVQPIPTVYYALDGISNGSGTAFESPMLRKDMIHCYEKEIIPFEKRFPFWVRWMVGFRYGQLIGTHSLYYRLIYSPLTAFCWIKKKGKQIVVAHCSKRFL